VFVYELDRDVAFNLETLATNRACPVLGYEQLSHLFLGERFAVFGDLPGA